MEIRSIYIRIRMNKLRTVDWNHIRAFLVTAEAGSLSAAARQLCLTQPTLSRQVAALEAELGLLLFERIGRKLALTQAGRQLLEHGRRMGDAASALTLTASGQAEAIDGTIRITASDILSSYVLPPILHQLRQIAPQLTIDLVAANDIRDLMRREADIAIRHIRPEQPDLIARQLPDGQAHFYAATSYLDQHGRPQTREDLATHDFISFGDTKRMIEHARDLGLTLRPDQFRIETRNGLVGWDLLRAGFGIAPMHDKVAEQTQGIERIMHWVPTTRFPFWLITHRELHTSRKIRLVFDHLATALTQKI